MEILLGVIKINGSEDEQALKMLGAALVNH